MSVETESPSTKIEKAIHSEDQPLGKQVSGAPFAVVGLSYLLVLLVVTAAVAFGIWIF